MAPSAARASARDADVADAAASMTSPALTLASSGPVAASTLPSLATRSSQPTTSAASASPTRRQSVLTATPCRRRPQCRSYLLRMPLNNGGTSL